MKLEKIDHVVITVKNLNKTIDFYTNILGMKLEEFSSSLNNDQIRYAVSFGSQKINIHEEKETKECGLTSAENLLNNLL